MNIANRLEKLRKKLQELALDGFLVPRADEHQNEMVPTSNERLLWITGFHGSAGFAMILRQHAAVYVDGRYTLQAAKEVDAKLFMIKSHLDDPLDFATQYQASKIGFYAYAHSAASIARLRAHAQQANIELVALYDSPLDGLWEEEGRPSLPACPIVEHDLIYAGKTRPIKWEEIATHMKGDVLLETDLSNIAWFMNWRGADIAHTPVFLSYLLFHKSPRKAVLFLCGENLPEIAPEEKDFLEIKPYASLAQELSLLSTKLAVQADCSTVSFGLVEQLRNQGLVLIDQQSPIVIAKACKNPAEQQGARQAHLVDGIALVRFFSWLSAQEDLMRSGKAIELDEVSCANTLGVFRKQAPAPFVDACKDLSFETISAFAEHGAIVHYRATSQSNKALDRPGVYLLDSGGQYFQGTTDVTRTVAFLYDEKDPIWREVRERFTWVLQGHIRLAMAMFPKNTCGAQLDTLARMPLWQRGLDYAHGTGHGVGSYLGVHEGPINISPLSRAQSFEEGMIVSNEPGFYREGKYGIRIESLMLTKKQDDNDISLMYAFETLTLCPIDRNLVEVSFLHEEEKAWLNNYHALVFEKLAPYLNHKERAWLEEATKELQG